VQQASAGVVDAVETAIGLPVHSGAFGSFAVEKASSVVDCVDLVAVRRDCENDADQLLAVFVVAVVVVVETFVD